MISLRSIVIIMFNRIEAEHSTSTYYLRKMTVILMSLSNSHSRTKRKISTEQLLCFNYLHSKTFAQFFGRSVCSVDEAASKSVAVKKKDKENVDLISKNISRINCNDKLSCKNELEYKGFKANGVRGWRFGSGSLLGK